MKTLIEMHVLQNFAPSNLNRDDTGAPKDAIFGGTRRGRHSSQSVKRAVRQDFGAKAQEGVFDADELAVRTKRVYDAIADRLAGKRDPDEARAKATIALSYVKLNPTEDGKSQYLLFLGQREITELAAVIDENWDLIVPPAAPATDDKTTAKKAKKAAASAAPKEVQAKIEAAFNGGKAVDIALFGRMLADMPEKNQSAACQVAHSISTHVIERSFDFYTAVDDLKPTDTAGADMMGTIEFTSGCFYRYAVVDWDQLVKNLQGDEALAMKGLRMFMQSFVETAPSGKQSSFAAHNSPEFVAVSVRRNCAPRSLANAFETAVRPSREASLTRKSADALIAKANVLQAAYGGDGETFVLNLVEADISGYGEASVSLTEVLDKAAAAVKG
jgi:CRISPR system Cascade subunit CasC